MWIYFNQDGQKIDSIEHGNNARAGTTDFSIFAYFYNTDLVNFNTASIKLIRPDLFNSSYPLILMKKVTKKFVLEPDETSNYFEDGKYYTGFEFDFSTFVPQETDTIVLLDTPGDWRAVISLYDSVGEIAVQGSIVFHVDNGIEYENPCEISQDIINTVFDLQLAKKLDISDGLIIFDEIPSDLSDYQNGQLFYDKATGTIYQITNDGENPVSYAPYNFSFLKTNYAFFGTTTFLELKNRVFENVPFVFNYVNKNRMYLGIVKDSFYEFVYLNDITQRYISNNASDELTVTEMLSTTYLKPLATVEEINDGNIVTLEHNQGTLTDEQYATLLHNNSKIFYDGNVYPKMSGEPDSNNKLNFGPNYLVTSGSGNMYLDMLRIDVSVIDKTYEVRQVVLTDFYNVNQTRTYVDNKIQEYLYDTKVNIVTEEKDNPTITVILSHNTDKKVVNVETSTNITLTIPNDISHGYVSGGALRIGSVLPVLTVNNLSTYNLNLFMNGRLKTIEDINALLIEDGVLDFYAECNGFNVMVFFRETVDN